MRITDEQREVTRARIRATADRLLRGDLPPGGKVDVKTLAAESGVSRNALYTTYEDLRVEFEVRRARLRDQGEIVDPREGQIARLKQQVEDLEQRVANRDEELEDLRKFKTRAVSQIAAQTEEIERLRRQLRALRPVTELRPVADQDTAGGDTPGRPRGGPLSGPC